MNSRHSDDVLVGVFLNKSSLDLSNLRPHRSAERSATGVIEVQANDGS